MQRCTPPAQTKLWFTVMQTVQPSPASKFVTVNGVSIAYSEAGTGQVVLAAHGLTSSRAASRQLGLGDFSAVHEVARLIAYDARGHGESSGSTRAEDYAWHVLAGDMLALADHFSQEQPVSAIGLSMGTGTLLHAAVARPARFERLVLTAPPTAWDTRAGQVRVYAELASLAESLSPEALAQWFGKTPVAPIFQGVPNYRAAPDIPHELLPSVFRGAGLSDLPTPDALRGLHQPTLILAWATDPGHPVSTAERLAELLPNAQLHVSETVDDVRSWPARAARFLAP